MPYENVADVDGESLRCWVCDGILDPRRCVNQRHRFLVRMT